MTTSTELVSLASSIRVRPKRHRYFVELPGEKRTVLTTGKAKALIAELGALLELHHRWILEDFERIIAIPDDEPIEPVDEPLYAVSIFQELHSGDEIDLLKASLEDAVYGWRIGYDESRVDWVLRINREAEETFDGIDWE